MEKRGIAVVIVIIIIAVIAGYFIINNILNKGGESGEKGNVNNNIDGIIECESSSDCVPDSCCHAKECVAKEKGPDCSGIMCTQDCEPGTLDCGQGNCICENKKCKVVFS